MAQIKFQGPLGYRLRSLMALNRIALGVYARHAIGQKIAPDWDANMEIGIRFWRHQFTKAMNHSDIKVGRRLYNSLHTATDDVYSVTSRESSKPIGQWFTPELQKSDKILLYFHGGGYTFGGPNSIRFAEMLAHHMGVNLFMPQYRRTPEHPHPAQAEDAMEAWDYLCKNNAPENIIVIGDSAGGHMALMLLQALSKLEASLPHLCIALCPWVDIGARGESMTSNNQYDLVQGWMAVRFGKWLNPDGSFSREEISPINQNYSGLAPIYIQAGGREIFRDPVTEFATIQANNGAAIMLDIWEDMPHDFQAYDSMFASSTQALRRLEEIVQSDFPIGFEPLPNITKVSGGACKTSLDDTV